MMKNNIIIIGLLTLMMSTTVNVQAQKERNHGVIWSSLHGLEYQVKAGFNIGGASPIPLPEEIRSINGYSPNINLLIEGNVTKWLSNNKKWGVLLGLRLENKGMETNATVKNYGMEIIGDGGERLSGYWTGKVKTKYRASLLTVPVQAVYKLNSRVRFSGGPYVAYMMNGDFEGHVSDGYLRKGDPTGTKAEFAGDDVGPYNFSDNLRNFQWGLQIGTEWRAFKHLNVYADLAWGLNDIFEKDFKTITFTMYPIYLNVGFGYAF